jgi:thioesterase domain-containing protein
MIRYEAPAYGGPAVFFRATEIDAVNPSAAERAWLGRVGALEIVPVGGNHTTMNLEPHVARIVEHLSPLLTG